MSVGKPVEKGPLLGLLAVLLLGALLRFTGLSWGLRHPPPYDEAIFVESVQKMLTHGDLDQRFYEYPGLFFYILYPALAVFPHGVAEAGTYLAARGVVAAFGVASVGLAYVLAARLAGVRAGLAAALLLAVSPVEVRTAHMVRPDVVLETFVLMALLACRRLGTEAPADLRVGAALGAAAAVKFTGILLVPSYLVARVLAPGRRLRGMLRAAMAGSMVWLALTPYAVLRFGDFVRGVHVQWAYHYKTGEIAAPQFTQIASYYFGTIVRGVGLPGAALAALGLVMARKEWRSWAPLLAYPVVMIGVLSTAEARWDRLLLSVLGIIAVLAGLGVEQIARRAPRAAVALAVAAALPPLAGSLIYDRNLSRPGTRDRALDWIEAHVPPGSTIFTDVHDLGIDRSRFEVLWETGRPELDRIASLNAELVVREDGDKAVGALTRPAYVAEPDSVDAGPRVVLYRVEEKPHYRRVSLAAARLSASSNAGDLPMIVDGRRGTAWRGGAAGGGSEWVQIDLPTPVRLGRIELVLGNRPDRYGRALVLEASEDLSAWRRVPWTAGRSAVGEQAPFGDRGASQVLLFEPLLARGVRLREEGRSDRRWGFAEILLDEVQDQGPGSANGRSDANRMR